MWYSWQRSDSETSEIRECFSPEVLLGSISDPLLPEQTCRPKDITESPGSGGIMACLCDTDLCNAKEGAGGAPRLPPPPAIQERPRGQNGRPGTIDDLLILISFVGYISTILRPNL